MKVVVLGATGLLGSELVTAFQDHEVIAFSRNDVDITVNQDLQKIKDVRPDVVINAAAYTDVEGAEENEDIAFAVNAYAVGAIAKLCKEIGCTLIHYSTDYVFDGKKEGYIEDDGKNPLNVYGKSKALGEDVLVQNTEKYSIIRSSWLFGKNGRNFVETIIATAGKKEELNIVNDQFGCPTYARDLAEATLKLVGKSSGIYHITNAGSCSWFEFAQEIIKLKHLKTRLHSIPSRKLRRKADRPKNAVLKNTKTELLRHWKSALKDYLR